MRRLLISTLVTTLSALAATAALAQQQRPRLEPLPEPPPPPAIRDGVDEPRVRIAPREGDRVEEVRDGGRVIMIKVTPPNGIPYYMIDTTGNGQWARRESLDDGLRPPMWTIKTFD